MLMAVNGMGARTLGIDPAANIVEIANERGVDVHVAYFNPATAAEVLEKHEAPKVIRSEEHTSELQSLMRTSYAVFCLKKKNHKKQTDNTEQQYTSTN